MRMCENVHVSMFEGCRSVEFVAASGRAFILYRQKLLVSLLIVPNDLVPVSY